MWFVSANIFLSFCPIRGRPVHIPHIFYEEPSKYGTRRCWALKYIFVFPPIIYLFGQLEIYGQRRKYIFKYVLVRLSPGDIIIVGDSHLVTLSALLERHWASSEGGKPSESGHNNQNEEKKVKAVKAVEDEKVINLRRDRGGRTLNLAQDLPPEIVPGKCSSSSLCWYYDNNNHDDEDQDDQFLKWWQPWQPEVDLAARNPGPILVLHPLVPRTQDLSTSLSSWSLVIDHWSLIICHWSWLYCDDDDMYIMVKCLSDTKKLTPPIFLDIFCWNFLSRFFLSEI